MNKEEKKFVRDFIKYRKMQGKLTKLRSKKPSPQNVQPVTKLLRDIEWHLKDMDKAAAALLGLAAPASAEQEATNA